MLYINIEKKFNNIRNFFVSHRKEQYFQTALAFLYWKPEVHTQESVTAGSIIRRNRRDLPVSISNAFYTDDTVRGRNQSWLLKETGNVNINEILRSVRVNIIAMEKQ